MHLNRSEIGSNIKRKLLGLKWVGNTTRQSTPYKREPQVGRGLFGVHLLIFHFKFQTVVMFVSIDICLKRDQEINQETVLSDVKVDFTCIPALIMICSLTILARSEQIQGKWF